MPNIRLKRYNGAAWENVEVQTNWSQILNKPSTFTPTAHTHSGNDITSGKVAPERLGSGQRTATTFLNGEGDWATISALDNTKLPLTGGTITLQSGVVSNVIMFNTGQTYTGPYIRGNTQELFRGYFTDQHKIWDAGNDGSGSGLDADLLDGIQGGSFLRNDVYNSANAGLQVLRNIGSQTGSYTDNAHTFGLENNDAGNIAINFHRAGYTSNNIWCTGSDFNFDLRTIMPAWDTNARNFSREWIEFPNHTGLYSPLNNAHFYPNNLSYGAWKVTGSRNGYNGIEFVTSNGNVSLIVQNGGNTTGFHNNGNGWQFYWDGGTLRVGKNTYGGGTMATVLDSANYTSFAPIVNSTSTQQGGIKTRLSGTTLFITNNGNNA